MPPFIIDHHPMIPDFPFFHLVERASAFIWDVDPILFTIGSVQIRWYGALFATGFLIGYSIMRRTLMRENDTIHDLDSLLTHVIIGTIVGARLGQFLFYEPGTLLRDPLIVFQIWKGGLASHGGTIGVVIALFLYLRKRQGSSFLWLADRMAYPVALVSCMIRIGNFFNSEILGTETDGPLGICFPRSPRLAVFPGQLPHPVHPAMLYEAAAYLATFILLGILYHKFKMTERRGFQTGLFFVCIFGSRFFVEYVKMSQEQMTANLPLSMGQILSIPAVLIGLLLMVKSRRRAA